MENKVYSVTIPLEKYEELLEDSFNYDMILDYLDLVYKNTSLGYDKKSLRFDEDYVSEFLKVIDRNYYNKQIEKLKREENNE